MFAKFNLSTGTIIDEKTTTKNHNADRNNDANDKVSPIGSFLNTLYTPMYPVERHYL